MLCLQFVLYFGVSLLPAEFLRSAVFHIFENGLWLPRSLGVTPLIFFSLWNLLIPLDAVGSFPARWFQSLPSGSLQNPPFLGFILWNSLLYSCWQAPKVVCKLFSTMLLCLSLY